MRDRQQVTRVFWLYALLVSVAIHWTMPILGDEAYMVSWGRNPALGYYDHPPLTGWVSSVIYKAEAFLGISQHGTLHRIFIFGLAIFTIFWLRGYLRRRFPDAEVWTALSSIAVLPATLVFFNNFYNDTVLTFFLLGFLVETERALRLPASRISLIAAGVFFGLALFTKYTAAVFYLGVVVALLTTVAGRHFLFRRFVLITLIASIPFIGNMIWNYYNCGVNLAFNFAFRDIKVGMVGWAYGILSFLLIMGPTIVFIILRSFRKFEGRPLGFFTLALYGTLAIMLIFALQRGYFGPNWAVPLLAPAILAAAEIFSTRQLHRLRIWNTSFSVLIVAPMFVLLASNKLGLVDFEDIGPKGVPALMNQVFDLADGSLSEEVVALADGRIIAAIRYGRGAELSNSTGVPTVLFSDLVFGRNQDLFTDYRELDGQEIVFLPHNIELGTDLADEIFASYEIETVEGFRQSYPVIIGHSFDYLAYREEMILPVLAKYYDSSPFPSGRCFMDKYR